jgi:hypothetical protein
VGQPNVRDREPVLVPMRIFKQLCLRNVNRRPVLVSDQVRKVRCQWPLVTDALAQTVRFDASVTSTDASEAASRCARRCSRPNCVGRFHRRTKMQVANLPLGCRHRRAPAFRLTDTGHAHLGREREPISRHPQAGPRCRRHDGATAVVSTTSISFCKRKLAEVCPTSASSRLCFAASVDEAEAVWLHCRKAEDVDISINPNKENRFVIDL